MEKFYDLKVLDKKQLTPESVSISLEIPESLRQEMAFKPGQFVMVEKEIDGEKLRRYYSIYSPLGASNIQLGIKLKGKDGFADYAMHQLKPGETLAVSKPMDDVPFALQSGAGKKYLGITIGSGITPFFSIIQSLLQHQPQHKFVLIYGNQSPEYTMFYQELSDLEKKYPDQLKVYHAFSQSDKGVYQGRISEDFMQQVLQKEGTDFEAVYMIGPDDLKKMAAKVLLENGLPEKKLHYRVYS